MLTAGGRYCILGADQRSLKSSLFRVSFLVLRVCLPLPDS